MTAALLKLWHGIKGKAFQVFYCFYRGQCVQFRAVQQIFQVNFPIETQTYEVSEERMGFKKYLFYELVFRIVLIC